MRLAAIMLLIWAIGVVTVANHGLAIVAEAMNGVPHVVSR